MLKQFHLFHSISCKCRTLHECVSDLSAMLSGGLSSHSLDLLSVKLGCTAVIFGVGFTGSATMLVKKGRL